MPNASGAPAVRQPLFPNARPVYDDEPQTQVLERDKDGIMRADLPPAGHGAGFVNHMGFFGPTMGQAPAAGLGRPSAASAMRRPR